MSDTIWHLKVLEHFLKLSPATEHDWWYVNIGSGNHLVLSRNKLLPDPTLTQIFCHMVSQGHMYVTSEISMVRCNISIALDYRDATNNAWVTVNNDFFCHKWGDSAMIFTRDEWKSLPNRLTRDKKIVMHGNECIILFLTRYFMSWTHKSTKNYHRAFISSLLPWAAFSDRALWRHHNWSVTSCEREILVLWRHICLLSLHTQIGAKAITRE